MRLPAFANFRANRKPEVTLNIQQGPLGVTLTVRGKNFHAGRASISYIDSYNVAGMFVAPSDSGTQVGTNGTFVETNIIMPSSGPAGEWKIVVTDSKRATAIARYHVLAAPGAQSAGVPGPSPTPTPSPTPVPSPTVKSTPAISTVGVANATSRPPFPPLDTASTILILLVVGGTLGVAAFMLVLFIIPWGEYFHERNMPEDGQW